MGQDDLFVGCLLGVLGDEGCEGMHCSVPYSSLHLRFKRNIVINGMCMPISIRTVLNHST